MNLRTLTPIATLNDADKAKVDDLETKAVERCNADDDARSDAFLAETSLFEWVTFALNP